MQKSNGFSFRKIFLGGFLFIVFYFVVTWLYAMSVPASSGLAGGFAIAYFGIFLAVIIPAIVGIFLFAMKVPIRYEDRKPLPQLQSQQKQADSLNAVLLMSLFPVFLIILLLILGPIFSFFGRMTNGGNGTTIRPTGEYDFIIPSDPSQIRNY